MFKLDDDINTLRQALMITVTSFLKFPQNQTQNKTNEYQASEYNCKISKIPKKKVYMKLSTFQSKKHKLLRQKESCPTGLRKFQSQWRLCQQKGNSQEKKLIRRFQNYQRCSQIKLIVNQICISFSDIFLSFYKIFSQILYAQAFIQIPLFG
ncbi:unnamed protein product [Paramecium octaurelia]|uniref:Uncharacterized protein n=1 Tax=Paramecium octaurelia TaxID=43137 RepID=A0A8S1WZY9_PAROT|nr:unnamed protein product [Paramecium octaurelia]